MVDNKEMSVPKFITTKKLAERLNCCTHSILVYLGRAEFAHVKSIRIGSRRFFKGITEADLVRLNSLIRSAKARLGKLKSCPKQKHGVK